MQKFPQLIGVVHLPALPGCPGAKALEAAITRAVHEARALENLGFDGLIVENFGDAPFFKDRVPPVTIAAMTRVAAEVRAATKLALGVNVLRNDARAALAVAAVTGASFIRVNVLSGAYATDQGIIEGEAASLARERKATAPNVALFADVHVKHARPLSQPDFGLALEETALRAGADAVIVTGETTGREVDERRLALACEMGLRPVYVGSGATAANLARLKKLTRSSGGGVIVGSALRAGGRAGAKLDARRAREFVRAWRA
jgi:membrane complex biogenesis BtpA family protein